MYNIYNIYRGYIGYFFYMYNMYNIYNIYTQTVYKLKHVIISMKLIKSLIKLSNL